jgi:hypothetical protein
MELRQDGDTLRFTISPAQSNREILPEMRSFRLIFRDIEKAKLTVNGCALPYEQEGVSITVFPERETVVELTQTQVRVNPPKEQLRTDLLTRVQGEIVWKNTVLNQEKRMPTFVRESLKELDCLEY